jgi:AraC-like DNA-binding protein
LGCEIEFGSNVDEVVFPEGVKLMPIGSADAHLNKLLLKYCDEAVSHREANRSTLRLSLENVIAPLLPHGKARAGEIARRMGMSQRTLARRLASEGVTFSGILDELKADLAKSYLRHGNLPISKIAWLLGYREISAFTHAFRRWTGTGPRQSRIQEPLPSTNSLTEGSVLSSEVRSRR